MKNSTNQTEKYLVPLLVVMCLMFFWNLSRNINDVLIPHLKRACQLTDLQSSLIQSAFFSAYFLVAIPAGQFIQKKGYKAGMVAGLLLAASGAFLFYPAAETRYYPMFLAALFIMAAGFTFLEVTATPYISKLGDETGASGRLSLSAAFGSFGATVAPYIASMLLLHKKDVSDTDIAVLGPPKLQLFLSNEAGLVKLPYLILAALFLSMCVIVSFIKFPAIKEDGRLKEYTFKNVFRFPHALAGVGAVFCYVGAEVGIVSFMIRYAKSLRLSSVTEQKAALFISLFMGLVLIGRLMGAFVLKRVNQSVILMISASMAFLLVLTAMITRGYVSLFALAIVGFFTSVMYPIIFTLSIKGIGGYAKTVSSLLIMSIVGAAIIPPVMGYISDKAGIKWSYLAPMLCYVYVLYFALKGHRLKMQVV